MPKQLARLAFLLLAMLGLGACSLPDVYKLDIQQGNIITQDMVNQLQPGMNKRQVRFIMGTPLLVDSFHEERWDYFYSLRNSQDEYSKERLTLFFENGVLHHMQGNFRPGQGRGATRYASSSDTAMPGSKPKGYLPPTPTDAEVYPLPPDEGVTPVKE